MEYNYDGNDFGQDPIVTNSTGTLSRGKQLGFSIAGMACGIWGAYFGVFFGWCYGMGIWLGLPFGIVGLILSSKVLKCNPERHAMATAGKITSIVSIIASVVWILVLIALIIFYIIVYGGLAAYSIFNGFDMITMMLSML